MPKDETLELCRSCLASQTLTKSCLARRRADEQRNSETSTIDMVLRCTSRLAKETGLLGED